MNSPLKIVFLGTPEFACPTLQALLKDSRFEVMAVITQEDKKVGRKQELTASPVKKLAMENSLPVFQPVKLSRDQELIDHLKELKPDFLVVVAYGQIVSQKVLDIPTYKPINIHGSILPKYRGASPIEQTLLNGDAEAGISIMEMTLKMDQGPVYEIHKISLTEEDNNPLVREKLSSLGAEKLPDCLLRIARGEIVPQVQDENLATYCQKISKEDGLISPAQDKAATIINKLRAFTPWPGIFLNLQGKKLKINRARSTQSASTEPGKFDIKNKQLFLHCQDFQIEILELQLEGKNNQPASTFLLGNTALFR
jgi:methionyl-tRNA formyltransferase